MDQPEKQKGHVRRCQRKGADAIAIDTYKHLDDEKGGFTEYIKGTASRVDYIITSSNCALVPIASGVGETTTVPTDRRALITDMRATITGEYEAAARAECLSWYKIKGTIDGRQYKEYRGCRGFLATLRFTNTT